MKKIFLAIILCLSFSFKANAKWTPYLEGKHVIWHLGFDSVAVEKSSNSHFYEIDILMDYKKIPPPFVKNPKNKSTTWRIKIDCLKKEFQGFFTTRWDGQMGSGNVIEKIKASGENGIWMKTPPPNSPLRILIDEACEKTN